MNIIGSLLEQRRVSFTRIDGDVSYAERSRRLQSFENNPHLSVLLMTFGTGAVGWVSCAYALCRKLADVRSD